MDDRRRVVVIGTGPAGAAAAVFLARAGLDPLLLEAGSGKSSLGLTARIRGLTVAKFKCPIRRRSDLTMTGDPAAELFEELAPGGLSNHWACAVPRFSKDDFDDAARGGEVYRWPIDYEELAPWYDRVEPLLRISGSAGSVARLPAGRVRAPVALDAEWDGFVREAAAASRDVVAMPYAFGRETTVTRAATPFNAYTRLVKPAERRAELALRFDAAALELIWSKTERRVTAVVARNTRTGAEDRIPCRAVVLAAGAVNSARILLESRGAEFPSGLGNSRGVLGRYLHDHPLAKIVVDLGRAIPIAPASYVTRPALDRSAPLYAAACMQWSGAMDRAKSLLSGGRVRRIGFSVFGTMPPTADDGIELRGAATENESRLALSLRHPPEAVKLLEQTRDELIGFFARSGFEPHLQVFRVEPPGNSVHYGGTCRMHASPEFGVVDEFCRVYDAPNVVVADSAVFTTGPEKNPVLTAMTLAARASARLADELLAGDL